MGRKVVLPSLLLAVAALLAWRLAARRALDEGPARDAAARPAEEAAPAGTLAGRGADGNESAPARDEVPLGDSPLRALGFVCTVHARWGEDPVAGATVRLRAEGPEPFDFAPLEATTDDAGEARIGPFPVPRVPRRLASSVRLVAEVVGAPSEGEACAVWGRRGIGAEDLQDGPIPLGPVTVDPSSDAGTRWFRLALVRAFAQVEGRVLTEDGAPLEGACVDGAGAPWLGVRTDADGRFRVDVAAAGTVTLRATWNAWNRDVTAEERVAVAEGGRSDVEIRLRGLGEVSGRALEADGRPAAGAEICLTRAGSTVGDAVGAMFSSSSLPAPSFHLRRLAGSDGSFRFVGTLDGEAYDVRWWETQETDRVGAGAVPSGTRDVEVRLDRHGVLPRPVEAAGGEPVSAEVSLRHGTEEWGPRRRGSWWPNQDGFVLPAGASVVVHVSARGYDDAVVEHVVGDAPGLEVLPVPLRPRGSRATVRIRCVGGDGAPRPWPVVRWRREPGAVGASPAGHEDADGAFETTDLAAGTYRLATWDGLGFGETPRHAGLPQSGALRFVAPSETRVEVPASGRLDLDWPLRTGGALRITTRGADGAPCDAGDMRSLRATDAAGEASLLRLFHASEGGWKEGTSSPAPYETQALPPGTYDVLWTVGPAGPTRATARVVVREGEVTPLDLVDALPGR